MRPFAVWVWIPLLAGCGTDLPRVAHPSALPAKVVEAAMPLEQAVAEGVVKVSTMPESTLTELRLRLQPVRSDEIWIRIDPGWQVPALGAAGNHFVTYEPRVVRLPGQRALEVDLPHLLLRYTRATGVSYQHRPERNRSVEIHKLLAAFAGLEEPPERKILQFALWCVADKVSYRAARAWVGKDRVGKDRQRNIKAGEVMEVAALLDRLDFGRDFPLWTEAVVELEQLVERYAQLTASGPEQGLDEFRRIGAFYPMPMAVEVVRGAFDKHQGEGGRAFRSYAVDCMRRFGGADDVAHLRKFAQEETDPAVRKLFATAIRAVAAAPR